MNIPRPRRDGWTPSYLEELRQVADSLIPHINTTICRWLTLDEWREMIEATKDERRIFSYYAAEHYRRPVASSPEAWLNHRVAERYYQAAQARFARTVVTSKPNLADVCLWCGRIADVRSDCEYCNERGE